MAHATPIQTQSNRPLGLMAALPQELQAVLDAMPDEQAQVLAGRRFWRGHWAGHEVVAVVSGIGKVAAATTATLLLQHFGVCGVVFCGVAGGLGPGVRVGDVVVPTTLLQHDMNAAPLFPTYQLPGYGTDQLGAHAPWQQGLLAAAQTVLAQLPQRLGAEAVERFQLTHARAHPGLLISGDRFVSTAAEAAALRTALPTALAVEMEGAAVAQVCHDFAAPFAALRTISDRADEHASTDFTQFVNAVASHYSADILATWLACQTPPLS